MKVITMESSAFTALTEQIAEILRLLEDNTVRNEEGTIDTLFHNHTLRTGGKPKGRRT